MRNQASTITVLAATLLLAACGTQAAEPAEPDVTTAVTADALAATTTTTAATTTTVAPDDGESGYEVLSEEVVYHEDDDGTWAMDVFYPDAEGPWPLVIVYHGMSTLPARTEARVIAKRGAVAVAPQWIKATPPKMTREGYIDGMLFDRAACAVNAAQHVADDYGADPTQTTVSGFSAGMHPTHWVGLGIVRDDLCDETLLHRPVGVVLGDNQFLFFEEGWDDSLADANSQGADTLDRFINPERWDVPDDLAAYLWTSDFFHGRGVDNPPGDDSWIHLRDANGTLVDDLAAVGAFDDEDIDFMDNGLLMERRMTAAGIEVVHEAVGGGHSYSDTVYDAIDALISR